MVKPRLRPTLSAQAFSSCQLNSTARGRSCGQQRPGSRETEGLTSPGNVYTKEVTFALALGGEALARMTRAKGLAHKCKNAQDPEIVMRLEGSLDSSQGPVKRPKWHPTPVLLPGRSHGWRSLVGYSPRCRTESDTTERLHLRRERRTS